MCARVCVACRQARERVRTACTWVRAHIYQRQAREYGVRKGGKIKATNTPPVPLLGLVFRGQKEPVAPTLQACRSGMHDTHDPRHAGPRDSQGPGGPQHGLRLTRATHRETHGRHAHKLCYIETEDGEEEMLNLDSDYTHSGHMHPGDTTRWPVPGVELMCMRTGAAASVHGDSGLTLRIRGTENPTDIHTGDHLTITSLIYFFFFKTYLSSVLFSCILSART